MENRRKFENFIMEHSLYDHYILKNMSPEKLAETYHRIKNAMRDA